ncbi:EF-hand domain-containing protein [Stieleria sp. JC731]|uniref:EF-hand domain-containing protein n=1 Tax=Pirellulaceae TaxID=2691357 RepID=UPI001E3CA3FD|nr:EF-hand domain-containing protein [Stieleria sp. JC731]MCC9601741.1 EF-hand domain-containing protein [Stieleria sp. JC731]
MNQKRRKARKPVERKIDRVGEYTNRLRSRQAYRCLVVHVVACVPLLIAACDRSTEVSSTAEKLSQTEKPLENGFKVQDNPSPDPHLPGADLDNVSSGDDVEIDLEADVAAELDLVSTPEADMTGVSLPINVPVQPMPKESPLTQSTDRLWIPTGDGILLLGLNLLIDGVPIQTAFDQRMERLEEQIKGSDSEYLRWEDFIEYARGNTAVFGSSITNLNGQARMIERQYDRNGNNIVDRGELERIAFRDAMLNKPFQLFGTDAYNWISRHASPLYQVIDSDSDGLISETDLVHADQRILAKFDSDLDRCVSLDEVARFVPVDDQPWRRSRSSRRGEVAMNLDGIDRWQDFAYTLGGIPERKFWYLGDSVSEYFDSDRDSWISPEEASRIGTLEPKVILTIDFGVEAAEPVSVWVSPGIESVVQINPISRECWLIESASGSLCIRLHDEMNRDERLTPEQFEQLDQNGDAFISADEIPDQATARISIPDLDLDKDRRLSFEELARASKKDESIWRFQVRARAASFQDLVFACLDQDCDHYLSSREIADVPDTMRSLGMPVGPDRLPESVVLQLVRGEPANDDEQFMLKRLHNRLSDSRPRWAVAADTNGDREIASSEFVGPIELFRQLDQDGDQYLSVHEVLSAENQYEGD